MTVDGDHTLESIAILLAEFDSAGVRFVHWKSNINVSRALAGEDDLDLLVHPDDLAVSLAVLERQRFVAGIAARDSWHEGMSHYYSPDLTTRTLVHVHLHDRLTLGFDFDKNYTLPVVQWYLSSARRVREMPVPAPENELILFTVRTLVKHARLTKLARFPVGVRSLVADRLGELTRNERAEFDYLNRAADREALVEALATSGLPIAADDLIAALDACLSNPSSALVQEHAGVIKRAIAPYRNRSEFASFVTASGRLASKRVKSIAAKFGVVTPRGRKFGLGGRIIAFLGGDGAGKSSNVEALYSMLKRHFDTEHIHVGRPSRSVRGAILTLTSRVALVLRVADRGIALRHLALAYDRRSAFRRAEQVRARGGVAVLDRLPTPWVRTMDAPRIVSPSSVLSQHLAASERRIYAGFQGVDLLVVLRLNPEIALQRRPEDDPEHLRARSGEIWNGTWTAEYMHPVDTGENDLPTVLHGVTKRAWETICAPFIRTEIIGLSGAGKSTVIKQVVENFSNVKAFLPYRSRPLLFLRCATLEFMARPPRGALGREIFSEMVHLRWFIAAQRHLRSPFGMTAHHYILDQGPVFELARGLMEAGLSPSDPLYRKGIDAVEEWRSADIVRVSAPKAVREARLKGRPGRATRSMMLTGQEAAAFNDAYRDAFRVVRAQLGSVGRVSSDREPSEVFQSVLRRLRRTDAE